MSLDSDQQRMFNLILNVLQSLATLGLFWWMHRNKHGGPPST